MNVFLSGRETRRGICKISRSYECFIKHLSLRFVQESTGDVDEGDKLSFSRDVGECLKLEWHEHQIKFEKKRRKLGSNIISSRLEAVKMYSVHANKLRSLLPDSILGRLHYASLRRLHSEPINM